jgi:drug/metabolite transporter (DMT)-like permease
MWGLVFVAPLLLPEYPAALQSFGRYLAFGLIALPLAWLDRARLALLTRADWIEAAKLGAIGNIVYYLFLASSIQRAGGALPTMIIGTLPVVIAITSNLRDHRRDGRLPWARLAPSLLLIAAGIALVNHSELAALRADRQADVGRYALGAVLALGAVACWTWYPLRNADWLRAHVGSPGAARRPAEVERAPEADREAQADRSATTWATAQGLATLPLAAAGYAGAWAWAAATGSDFGWPLGPRPAFFVGLMLAIGLFASWLGTLCWNQASQRLPTTMVGQLIVFETLAALAYAFALRGHWPEPAVAAGIALLVGGVLWALRVRPEPPVVHSA